MRLSVSVMTAAGALLALPWPVLAQCSQGADDPGPSEQAEHATCSGTAAAGIEARLDYDRPTGAFIVSLRYPPDSAHDGHPTLRGISFLPKLPIEACSGPLTDVLGSAARLTGRWTSMGCRPEGDVGAVLVFVDTDAGTIRRSIQIPSRPPADSERALDALPAGVILPWYSEEPFPSGFVLCDGTDGVPDLVDRFALGTDDVRRIGSETGSASHEHTVTRLRAESPRSGNGGSSDGWNAQGMNQVGAPQTTGLNHTHGIGGSVDPADNIPPSTRVMFICKR